MSLSLFTRASTFVRSGAAFALLASAFTALAQTGPAPFTYVERSGVATNVFVTSEAKIVTGFDGTLTVNVAGEGSPQFKVGSGTFTSTAAPITAGQTLTIRHTSSSSASTPHTSVVTVGSYQTNFRSVTGTADRTPDAFDFGLISNTPPSSFVESPVLTLTGYNGALALVPSASAQYRINGGSWTNATGTLTEGQTLQLRHTTAAGELAYTKSTIKAGNVTGTFTTRNRSLVNQAPVAHAGADQTVDENASVTLDGSASTDEGTLSYAWTQTAGPSVTLANATTATPSFNAPNVSGDSALTFSLTVTDDRGLSATDAVTITVLDTRTVSIADASAAESAGTMSFTVTVSPAAARTITVQYATAHGTATSADYTGGNGVLSIAAGSTTAQLVIAVTADTFDENNETFTVGLSNASGAVIGNGLATGTITDDDDSDLLRIGAAKRIITPTDAHIAGIEEDRVFGAGTQLQKFNLGGFGLNPLGSVPDDPIGITQMASGELVESARHKVYRNQAGVEEHTTIRALALQEKNGDVVVFLMMDAVGAGNIIQKGVKTEVIAAAAQAGVTLLPENILFGQTHSHAGADLQGLWGGVPATWLDCDSTIAKQELVGCGENGWNKGLYQFAAEAVKEALDNRVPARLTMRQGNTVEHNSYRRPRTTNPDADADGTITLLQAVADDGAAIGSLLQYNAHPVGVNVGGARTPHGDYIYGATQWIEQKLGGTALYFNGPIADATGGQFRPGCSVGTDGDYGEARCKGEGLADYILQPANALATRELAPTIEPQSVEVYLPVTNPGFLAFGLTGTFNRYYNFMDVVTDQIPGIDPYLSSLPQLTPVARTHVSRITLGGAGGLEVVTIPGETTNSFGQYIRGLADTNVMLLGLTHNSFGYILPEDEFSYVDQTGDAGLAAPFTGYEEMVSLGPLTAPMLRTQGYNVLFGVGATQGGTEDVPPSISSCVDGSVTGQCLLETLQNRIDSFLAQWIYGNGLSAFCRENAGPFAAICAVPDAVESLVNELPPPPGGVDAALVLPAAEAQLRGCDLLDPANCLYPFPNDWFTATAAPGTIQHEDRGGTGRRVNMSPLAMPRNAAGKPVDPTEWNRSDGFSPGALITTFVPNLSLEQTFALPSHQVGLANLALSQSPDAPILVLEVQDNGAPARHLVWSEIDQNANILTISGAPNVGTFPIPGATNEHGHVQRPGSNGKTALLIRPAKNFAEGKRYVVVLRKLKDGAGRPIAPQAGFQSCVDGGSALLPVQARCEQLNQKVFPVLRDAGIAIDDSLFLAWDFTVESTESAIGRLRHMRDDAFASLSSDPADEDCTQLTAANAATCASPKFTITNVMENPQTGIKRRIEGMLTVPNYLAPISPSPAENTALVGGSATLCANAPGPFASGCNDLRDLQDLGQGAAIPNRLFYSPADGTPAPDANNPFDPTGLRYGDGLPDQNGNMTTRFLCQIPTKATPDAPARASLYGHGQLDRGVAITYEGTPDVAREHNYMFCAVDWFGFRTGDAVNVLGSLVDLSNFAVVPDASQQGMVNFMFLARAMAHPQGLGALPEFQDPTSGRPLFDRSEVFYNGNSQGGIFGGVVLAASKDVNRGVLGSLGMNYSTLLTRSKNFDEYAGVLYAAYPDPLDRQVLFSLMQMLWDRSENNGYAHHIVDNSAFGGPTNIAKLDTMYGDPQVTMFSAEVMARTMGVPYDDGQLALAVARGAAVGPQGTRHPTVEPYYGLERLDYDNPAHVAGGALYTWDTADNENAQSNFAHVPPTTNTPPRTGPDRHDASQKRGFGRCHMAHFLRTGGTLIDILPVQYGGVACPVVPAATPTVVPGEPPVALSFADAVLAAIDRFVAAISTIPGHLGAQDLVGALDAVIGGTTQLVADASGALLQQVGHATGIGLAPPAQTAVNKPAPQALMAGVAKRAIEVPIGTPLGGYLRPTVAGEYIGDDPVGEITDNLPSINDSCDPTEPASCIPNVPLPDEARKAHSPYATVSPPSRGYYDSLTAKAVALFDGNDYVVMVKTDFIGMLDEVVQDVKAEVEDRTDIDLGDGLIMSATHSHDGPGAVANHSTRYFWLAMDTYQHDVYVRVIGQLADVVVAALADLRPARVGHGNGLESPQTVNGINGFRRGRLASYANDDQPGCAFVDSCTFNDADELRKRIGVIRVDDAVSGAPIAVVINFAQHGIAFDVENQFFSGDVLGSIEREVEQSYVKPAGASDDWRGPLAMLVQNTGGDVTPKNADYSIRGIEQFGQRMAPQVRAVSDAIVDLQAAPDLRSVSQRVILNRERLGYAEDEYPYPWGAAQCGNDLEVPFAGVGVGDIPGYNQTGLPTKHLYCIPSTPPDAADLADNGVAENGAFVPGDTILYAAKIGAITLMVQPGEPLTEYGVRLLEMAQAEGFEPKDTFVWGYAGDHIGYILPPVEEDWATFGGAESTTTFWGWKQGQRFIDVSRDLVRALRDETAAPADEFQVDYTKYRAAYDAKPPVPATLSILPGTVTRQPSNIKRFQKTALVFEGGDPVVDFPQVKMVNAANGTVVRRANGEPMDSFFEMHLKYRLVSGRHLWTVEFEAAKDWAAGIYRFEVAGLASQGINVHYTVVSDDFTVAPATNLQATGLTCAGGTCTVRVGYAPVPMNYRTVDTFVNNNASAPMRTGTVTFSNGTDSIVVTADGSGNFSAAIGGAVTARATDAFGNTAPAVTTGGPPPVDTDGDGIPDTSDACPNEAAPGTPDGCPVQGGGEGFPIRFEDLCDPTPFDAGCADDIPGVEQVQGVLDTAWNAAMGGELPPIPPGGGGGVPGPAIVADTVADAVANAQTLPADLQASAETLAEQAENGQLANREAEAVVMEGRSFPDWSQPAAQGIAMPYPNGALTGERDAHAGIMLYPSPAGYVPVPTAAPVGEIVAFKRENDAWVEIPVQVDERFPYFLANPDSDFGIYSGTDTELTYAWDRETWKADGGCFVDPTSVLPTPDPVPGLDDDDEIAFMARDAGELADDAVAGPEGTVGGGQQIALADPLNPNAPKFVYLFRKRAGPTFSIYYVDYARDANADQWIDRSFFEGGPESDIYRRNAVGTSNTGYGPNLSGTVCHDGVTTQPSTDRFPRDGMTVRTDKYELAASGRWMVRDVKIAKPGQDRVYGIDIVDRWKGRAFQQSPDSTISVVGFEDEQVNWEANSALLGERAGPVRAIREIWGADSGTNVTKTETYYRDAYSYRYRVRVHPIPPDGLYTSWDYNRAAMVPDAGENVPAGRYYTAVRGAGVLIDGLNDDIGQIDQHDPVGGMCMTEDGPKPAEEFGGKCPLFFDAADPALNLPLTMYTWEQIAAKGNLGSLVYLFELKSATIGANAAAVPYYRDDACLDDGTGDDPVARPFPGESYRWEGGRMPKAYDTLAGRPLDHSGATFADCVKRQGAHAQHGVHFFAPPESDNATAPVPVNEIDGQQWAFAVPTERPTNVGESYANIIRAPLLRVVTPRPAAGGGGGEPAQGSASERGLIEVITDFVASIPGAIAGAMSMDLQAALAGINDFVSGVVGLVIGNDHASVVALVGDVANSPTDAPDDVVDGTSLLNGFVPEAGGTIQAGVGVVDMTPDVGYGAGQYSGSGPTTHGTDPYATAKKQRKSYGVMTRLSARAIVMEGSNGKRVALLKSDNYLAQDFLLRRVGQILEEQNSSIGYDQILYSVTHAHSSSYYSGSPAVAAFQDVMDPRFFEDQARKLAAAVVLAEHDLRPARMGATTVRHKIFKGQIMGPKVGDDGTPVQYPNEYGDLGLVVMRIETDEAQPRPIAVWVNWGEHPEGLDGYDLHSGDFVAYLERFVERDLKAPLVFSQGDVGSAEKSGNTSQRIRDDGTVCNDEAGETCEAGQGSWRDWNHKGFVQNERNVRFLADAVVKGWEVIGGERAVDAVANGPVLPNNYVPEVQVPLSNRFPVDYRNAFVPGPLSHPYPAVSNCRSEPTVGGQTGVPVLGLPDCFRDVPIPGENPISNQLAMIAATLRAEGVPVPEHYDVPSFVALEDNARLKLQAFRIGDIVLGSCACEAQVDLILNFESRANDVANDIYDGFDWACVAEDKGQIAADPVHAAACAVQRSKYYDVREFPETVPGSLANNEAVARMRAQVHNDARGWDAPEYVAYANAEPVNPALIKGNFIKEELAPNRGYKIAVGLGHSGDYNGYTVSYREYMSHDHYRKALTAYGSHTADYMVTRLVRMAGAMKGGAELAPEPHDTTGQADEARMIAAARAQGTTTRAAYEAWFGALPPDAGPAAPLAQPADTGLFRAANFTWRGGSTQVDNPRVIVERHDGSAWKFFADQNGEVQTRVQWPQDVQGVARTYAGQQEWLWTANFEAYEAFPARLGGTPPGRYRFVVEGCINDLESSPDESLGNRAMNFLSALLPRDVAALAGVGGNGCRGGAVPYDFESNDFEILDERELVTAVTSPAAGTLSITVAPTSIPLSYTSVFPYIRTANLEGGKYCRECSFRPWATSSSPVASVTVALNGGAPIAASGSAASWSVSPAGLATDDEVQVVATYADGTVSRAFRYQYVR